MWNKILILLLLFSVFVPSSLSDSDKYISKAKKKSLVIIFDATGSMSDDLDQLRAGSKILINGFDAMANNPIGNYILVVYRDDDFDAITPTIETTDKNVLFSNLDAIRVSGGADCPESAYTAIQRGLQNANVGSYVFVFTDASTKRENLRDEILKVVQKKNAKIYFFATGSCADPNHNEYTQLALKTNGLVFEVDRNKINQVFPNYLKIISDDSSDGDVFKKPAGKTTNEIDVDSTMDQIIVTIIAHKPVIKIIDPNKHEIKNYTLLTDEPKVKMIQVLNPIPGKWSIEVESKTPYSGQLSMISKLSFKYGFASTAPKSITQTNYYPLPGQQNIIIVTASNNSLVGDLAKVVLATETNSYEYKLNKKAVGEEILYMTDLISLPKEPSFKIYVFGSDSLGHSLKRLLSTDISAHDPDEPDTSSTYSLINVLEGQPIKLACQVNSPIALTIQWKKEGGDVLKEIKTAQSELLIHTIEYAELTDAGSYICSAENRIGRTEAKTIVDVRNVALNVNTPIKARNELEGTKEVVLKCVVIPRWKINISWQYNGSSILPPDSKLDLPNLILTTVKRSHSGTYTCIGKRASEEQQDSIVLNVFYPPTITNIIQMNEDLTSTTLDSTKSVQITNSKAVSFLCESDGSPSPKTHWFYGSGEKTTNNIIEINGNNPSASGSYICVAENEHGKIQKTINAVIQIPPILIEDYKNNFDLLLHDAFSLECPIQKINNNGENVEWFKNDVKIDEKYVNSGKLNFKIVEMGMNGSFICKASNLAGKVEAKFNMKILFPPQITNLYKSDDYSTTLINNKDLIPIINLTKFSVLCESIGNPNPTTTWIFQNGKKASENNILNIDASNPSASGIYTCQVQNNHGENQSSIRLKILVKPRLILNYKKYHELILNEEFQLECPIEKILNNDEIIEWFYNGKKLGSLYTKNGLLTLKKVPKDITGQFSCKASNAAGFVEATFDFNILFPPKIIKFLKSDEYTTSTMIDIKNPVNIINLLKTEIVCVSEGNPKPQINWMYDNSVIVSNNEKLEIDTNNTSASGIYSCKIENNQGTDVKDLNIKVLIPPKLQEEYDTQHYLILNEPFSLDCPYIHVDNNDEVTEWYHNGVIVDSFYTSDSEIYFQKVKMTMNGRFTCRVTNAAGNVEAHFLFDVHFPPKILNLVTIDNDGNENVIPTSLTNIDVYNTNSFEIVCKADGNPPPTVLWKRNKVDISSDNSLTIYLGSGMASGDYSCHIESYIGYDVRNIIIKEILPPKLIKNFNKLITATENSSLIIRCPVEDGEYDTTWNSNYDFSTYKIDDGSLEIPVLHRDMKTRLYCTASNKANTVSAFLELDVLCAPYDIVITTKQIRNRLVKINSTHTRIAAIHLEPFDLKCSAKANPPPEIMWVTGNRLYSKTDSIYIKSVKYEDNQVFRCIAKNDLKENSHFVQLIVFTPPAFVERNLIKGTNKMKYQKKMVTVIDGINVSPDYFIADFEKEIILDTDTKKKSYVMNCAATGNPNPNITWYKNGNSISHNKSTLELNSITSKDGGIYKCVCNNKYGSISQIFYIHVEVPYSLASISSTKYDYTENDEIRLTCITKGNFLPTITWRFANRRLVTNKNILEDSDEKLKYRLLNNEAIYVKVRHETHKSNIANLDNYGILSYEYKNGEYLGKLVYVIKSASIADSGNYLCNINSNRRYNNKKSSISKNSISIKVNVPPYYDSSHTASFEKLTNIPFTFLCPITGNPPPSYSWKKDGRNLGKITSKSIYFSNPTNDDSGDYICVGKNPFGEKTFIFRLDFVRRPTIPVNPTNQNQDIKTTHEVVKGESITLTCPVDKNVKKVFWWEVTNEYPQAKLIPLETQSLKLTVPVVFSKTIKCTRNHDDRYGKIFKISVLEKPSFQNPESSLIVVYERELLQLRCTSRGIPVPEIEWYKYDGSNYEPIRRLRNYRFDGSVLIKSYVTMADQSNYLCTAKNKLGIIQKTFTVEVKKSSNLFSEWSDWSTCSVTCGYGVTTRIRTCLHVGLCSDESETKECFLVNCPIDGGWSRWSEYSDCSKSCVYAHTADISERKRSRVCNLPEPKFNGKHCKGEALQYKKCHVPICQNRIINYGNCTSEFCCPPEYTYDNYLKECLENDVCKRQGSRRLCDDKSQDCFKGLKGYSCRCKYGFTTPKYFAATLQELNKQRKCEDINECKEYPDICGKNKQCFNTVGGYNCACKQGAVC